MVPEGTSQDQGGGPRDGPAAPGSAGGGANRPEFAAAPYRAIRVERRGGRLDIRLARPEVRNAFDETLIAELTDAFRAAAADRTVRCLVLSGEGPVFCAGADLGWMQRAAAASPEENRADARRLGALFRALWELPCTTVAAIRGAALGGGAGLAAAADAAIAAEDAVFGFTEVRLGIVPAVISAFAVRRIGRGAARRYFATGETFDGRRAAALGLVSEAVPAAEVEVRVDAVARQALSVGPDAARLAKRLADVAADTPYPRIVDESAEVIARVRATAEAREGIAAFLEKRKPAWPEGAP